jgi:hypothetical protein
MKIIDIGVCIDNKDPKGLGRIRCVRFSDYVSEKEKADKYEPFSENDLFMALPFLPANINFIPEIDQSVKILNYNTEKENVNIEYVAGPFTTTFNFNDQNFSPQTSDTTYGRTIKQKKDIFDKNQNYKKKKSIGSIAKKEHYGVYGKYGSDLIFTDNGLQLRGGKLLSKERANPKDRADIYSFPIMSKKNSTLTLKKFPYKMELVPQETKVETSETKDINFLIEYNLVNNSGATSISNPYSLRFYVYKITKPYGDLFKSNAFNENTIVPSNLKKLVNVENDGISPTHEIILNSTNQNDIAGEIRDILYTLHEKNLKGINPLYNGDDIHPFFFRPYNEFVTITGTTSEMNLKKSILSSIKVYGIGPKSGMIFSLGNVNPRVTSSKVTKQVIKVDKNSDEQSFSSLRSDKVYLLSTDTNKPENPKNYTKEGSPVPTPIKFENLDSYDLTQNNYVEDIDPNTYALVRGDNLVNLLRTLITVFEKHQHNVVGPPVLSAEFEEYQDLLKLKDGIVNDLLNQSIRIN